MTCAVRRRDRRTYADRAAGRRDGAARTTPAAGHRRLHPVSPGAPRGRDTPAGRGAAGLLRRLPATSDRRRPALPRFGLAGRTLEAVVSDLAADWMRQGFTRVLVLNGHWENSWTLLEAVERAIEPYADTHKALLVHWWDQVRDDDVRSISVTSSPDGRRVRLDHRDLDDGGPRAELVRTELKADGGAERLVTYDIFPPPDDILWPSGSATAPFLPRPTWGRSRGNARRTDRSDRGWGVRGAST